MKKIYIQLFQPVIGRAYLQETKYDNLS